MVIQQQSNAKAVLAQARAQQARKSLRVFTQQAWHVVEPATPFQDNWHIGAICEHLEAATRGEIRNLVINIPPRCGKSTIVSVMWPTWVWTFRPEFRWMFASYGLSLANRDSVKCRRLIESPWYQRHFSDMFTLAGDQNAKSRFENDKTGYRLATSVDSGVTGEGGNAVVADDPHNVRQVESTAEREAVLEWWDAAISSRLNDPKRDVKVIVMQRVHASDLTGHVLDQGGYTHLYLPMEYEPARQCVTVLGWHDPRTRDGDLLWPERIGTQEVTALKISLGSYNYAGQYQQRPAPREGGVFKRDWFSRRYRPAALPRMTQIVQAVDSAFKTGVGSDYSVIATWGTDGRDYYLLDLWRAKVDFPDLVRAIPDQAAHWNPQAILIEDAASGQSAIQQLRRDTNLPIIAVPAKGSKESRADSVSPLFEAGKVVLPEGVPWLGEFIEEHVNFPRAPHDDIVDTTSMSLTRLKGSGGRIPIAVARSEYMDPEQREAIRAREAAEARLAALDDEEYEDDTDTLEDDETDDTDDSQDDDASEYKEADTSLTAIQAVQRRLARLAQQRAEQQEREERRQRRQEERERVRQEEAIRERDRANTERLGNMLHLLGRTDYGDFGGFGGFGGGTY